VGSGAAEVTTGRNVRSILADLGHAAAGYAALGWPVHPCRPGGKEPLTRWRDAATTDPAVITEWWRRWPQANVAVVTGAPGPDVLDVDVKNDAGGMELFERARRAGLLRGAAALIRTPSGGLHLWFNGTSQGGGAIHRRALELKAVGGYVLVPPSVTPAGRYELVERRDTAGVIDWQAVRRLLDPPAVRPGYRRSAGNAAALAEWLSRQPEGNRNSGLFWACCQALDSGAADLTALETAAVAAGLPPAEARRTVESARRRKGAAA
jgi:hypothetical protein